LRWGMWRSISHPAWKRRAIFGLSLRDAGRANELALFFRRKTGSRRARVRSPESRRVAILKAATRRRSPRIGKWRAVFTFDAFWLG
jgi:hypothetical protein